MINKETEIIMQNICRSCMSESTEMKNLFETKHLDEGHKLQISEMLMACTSIRVAEDDGLPVQLCVACETKLNSAFEFKQQCEKSDMTLRGLISRPSLKETIKQESLDVVVQPDIDISEFFNENDADSDSSESPFNMENTAKKISTFTCSYCQKVLRTKKGLKIHQRRHTGEKMRSCHVCQAKFTRTNHLRRHLETHNRANKNSSAHICSDCGANFSRAYHLLKHKKQHKLENISVKKELSVEENDNADNECDSEDSNREEENNSEQAAMGTLNESGDMLDEKDKSAFKKVMECEFCDRKFKYRKSFKHHIQTEHGMSDESDVPLSTYVTRSLKIRAEIKKLDEGSDTNQTKEVEVAENSNDSDELEETELVMPITSKKSHSCHVCDLKFTRANHLTRHMTLHRAVLTHKCDRCDKAFATQEHLAKHTQNDHIDKPYVCTICNRPFSRGENLIRHLKIHIANGPESNLKCSICEKGFTRSDHLARHTKVHLQQDKRHVCTECGKAFNRLDNLKTHQRVHTGVKDNSRLHLCVYCGKEFNNSSNMIVHMRRHTGERPYKCDICGKGFPRSHDLKCHERTHSGEKPYLCTLCGKSFNKSNKLLRHTRVHTGERPYVCNICGRAFTQSNDLALHMRRHTGSRPYSCGVCSARFIQSGQLKAHRRSTGHWMETQPDLKGGYRVEPVMSVTNLTSVKFKTHGKMSVKSKEEYIDEEAKDPSILSQSVGILGNIIQNDTSEHSDSIVIESTKLLQQFQNAGFAGLHSAINSTNHEDDKFKPVVLPFIPSVSSEDKTSDCKKQEIGEINEMTFSNVNSAASTFNSSEKYYQNYS